MYPHVPGLYYGVLLLGIALVCLWRLGLLRTFGKTHFAPSLTVGIFVTEEALTVRNGELYSHLVNQLIALRQQPRLISNQREFERGIFPGLDLVLRIEVSMGLKMASFNTVAFQEPCLVANYTVLNPRTSGSKPICKEEERVSTIQPGSYQRLSKQIVQKLKECIYSFPHTQASIRLPTT